MDDRLSNADLAGFAPKDIDEALDFMHRALAEFHRRRDSQAAVFLRVYYEMTREVHSALHGVGDYDDDRKRFLDPDWVRGLSGKFATLYFTSLDPPPLGTPPRPAWGVAATTAADHRSGVLINALLGIVAHIRRDLPQAIGESLSRADLDSPVRLQQRKFDHDQVNDVLNRAMIKIQVILAKDYARGLGLGDRLFRGLDEMVSGWVLTRYREAVWWDAVTYAAARADDEQEDGVPAGEPALGRRAQVVLAELDVRAHAIANDMIGWWPLRLVERVLGLPYLLRRPLDRSSIVVDPPPTPPVLP